EAYGLYARICHTYGNGAPSSTGYAYYQSDYGAISNFKNMPEDGWVYITHNLTSYSYDSSTRFDPYKLYHSNPINDYFPAFLQFFANTDDMEAELLTIYIDDITLDYSDVVEDRNPPVISAPQVAVGANDFTALNGQTVTNNNVGFAATIAENTTKTNFTGLDYTTAKIYIDGADVSGKTGFSAAGSTISLGNLYLSNGEHRVTFEIADKQGNNTRLTKTITVDGDADNYPVWLDGYNNSGELAENGSIYYLDIGADYISQIDTVTAKLKLNTAHTFEFDHIWADDGVTFTYDYDQLTNTITLNITNVDSSKRDGTLVSVPVRVWEWNEEITGSTKAKQFATNNNPIVRIQAEIVEGNVTFKEGVLSNDYLTGFYSKVDVATKINDIVNPWHTHAPYAVPDVAPNCTESGYTGRTYCDGCESIMDWGTTVPAKGHTYDFDEDGDLRCVDCGDWFSGIYDGDGLLYVDGVVADGWSGNYCYSNGATLVGIQKVEAPDGSGEFYYNFGDNGECEGQAKYTGLIYIKSGDTYQYALAGTLTNGWVMIGEDWYYFDTTTNNAASGTVNVGGIDFEFETNGKLTQGVWLHTLFGERYYYGPDYYKKNWQTIDGKDYYFENEVCLAGGYQQIRSWDNQCVWYYFNEDGSCDRTAEIPDGFYTDRNGLGYSKDGIGYTGLQEIDGDWYYFDHRGYALIGTFAGRLFGEDYKGYTGLLDKAGVLYYYEDGVAGPYGLLELDDDYYFVNWGGVIATNGSYYASATNCDLPIGTYTFDEDGKALNGVYDGILYINGDTAGKGLYKVGDDYYLSNWGGVLETDGRYHVATTYCDISAGRSYYFGADGKMLNGVVETDGKLYLYINGDTTRNGLYKVGDDYYLSDWGGLLKTDGRYHVATTNCDIPAGRSYYFGADGKMLNGIYDGILYINGDTTSKGLFKIGDDYYLSYWGGVIFTDGRYHVDTTYCDIPAGRSYYFGADGKMLNGVVETDGTLYLYINGDTTRSGLYKVGDDYYLSNWGGVLKTDGTYYASATYCDLPIGNYIIGADGKMLNGIYDGILYINGDTTRSGLYKVGDDYYLSDWGGVLKTDGTYYASATYCDLPIGNYTVGADGKVLDGFVTKTDGIYLYQNGATAPIGLIEIDGSYYYVYWGGKLITSQTFHATVTNGLSIPKSYKFDATGKIIG
ncbi:MAG: hypothetical protein LBM65_04230, partial [Oscillospiraceae bacterium]|nr:hypothetical protein [Oscillospiraceae bacterium]